MASDGEISLIQQITTTSNPQFANLTVTQCRLSGGAGTAGNTYLQGSLDGVEGQMDIYADGVNSASHKKDGHISIVSSIAAYRGLPNSSGYGPSKAALTNLTESLYFDFKNNANVAG